jgi:predicted nucleic acid-binding protein
MSEVFADTYYFLALLNRADEGHAAAVAFTGRASRRLVTTTWVLTELADSVAQTNGRRLLELLVHDLEADRGTVIVPPDLAVWKRGLELYSGRPDKKWSLTDCISFVVMRERGITDALTADHHFEQAGYSALLKPPDRSQ